MPECNLTIGLYLESIPEGALGNPSISLQPSSSPIVLVCDENELEGIQ